MNRAKEILKAVAEASGVPEKDIQSFSQRKNITLARGVFCLLCRENKVKSYFVSQLLNRKIRSIQYLAKTYMGYYQVRDKEVVLLVDRCKKII